LLNFVSECLCFRRRTQLCALDSPLSHKVQQVNIIASTVPGIMQKDGDGWSPVASELRPNFGDERGQAAAV